MRRGKFAGWGVALAVALLLAALTLHRCSNSSHEVATSGSDDLVGSGHAAHTGTHHGALASIRGTIADTLGAGIAHARVCANVEEQLLPLVATRDPRCVIATERGTYELFNLLPANYIVTSLADGHLPGRLEPFDLHAGEHRDNADLVLQPGGVLVTGTVSDLGGGPISHAQVHAFSAMDYESTAMIETDDAGAFRITLWPGDIGLSAVADGYAQQYAWGTAPGTFAIVLIPASTISGTVVDSRTHSPVPDAVVELYPANGSREASGKFDVTDELGRFRFDRLDAERYAAVAHASHAYGRSDGSVRVGLGQHLDDMVVTLEPAVDVAGKVLVDGKPAKPCEKPGLSLWREGGLDLEGRPDGAGGVRVEGVVPGTYKVSPSCGDLELIGEETTLDVEDHDVTGLEWKFAPRGKGTIRGRVVDDAGAVVAGAMVSFDRAGIGFVTTKRDGSYELPNLHAGSYRLHVESPAGVTPDGGWNADVTEGGTVTKELRLHTGGSLVVTVVDKSGAPVEGATLFIDQQTLKTPKDGSLRVDNLPATSHHVMVDGTTGEDRNHDVQVRAGQVTTIKLVADQHHGVISGVVIGAESQPRGDVFVVASLEYGGATDTHSAYDDRLRVLTHTDGTFSIAGLTPGLYGVRAYEAGGAETILDHVKPGASLKLQLKPGGSIAGTVRTGDTTPDDFTVRIANNRAWFSRREHFYRTAGHYHFDDLPAGSYHITATDNELEGGTAAELTDGAQLTGIDVAFDASVTITGRVIDVVTRLPVAQLPVSASLENGRRGHDEETGSDGRFALSDLPAGTLDIGISRWDAEYSMVTIKRSGRDVVDLGDIALAKRRNKPGDKAGRFGITFASDSLRVDEIDPTAPAAKTELVVGDVVTSVDGIDLTRVPVETAWTLMSVAAGTAVRFGLARGATITMVAIPR